MSLPAPAVPPASSLPRTVLGLVLAGAALGSAAPAQAAGLYYADRGVRAIGRGGAYVAGGDDLGAIGYNPAGIYEAGTQFFFDASWLHFSSDYSRQTVLQQTDPNTGKVVDGPIQTFDPVQGTTPFLPIPTIAVSIQVHPKLVIALGAYAPYAALSTYPDPDNFKGKSFKEIENATPQRYSLITLDGSTLLLAGATLAWAPIKELRLGATGGVLMGKFTTTVAFSGCIPERFLCAQESPNWDVRTELAVSPIVSPYGQFGAVVIPHPKWRIGVSSQLPIFVRAPATVKTRLPSTPVFEKASQEGDAAKVAFDLPWNVKAGIETRMIDNLRLEAAFGFERWSMHDAIRVTPDHIALKNVALLPQTSYIPDLSLPRGFQDSFSVHLGGEYAIPVKDMIIDARAGVSFETSAVPSDYLTVLTIDSAKVTAALGGSLHVGKFRIDATYAHVFGFSTTADPKTAKITQISPVNTNPPQHPDIINGGTYSARADVVGLGVAYNFDFGRVVEEPKLTAPTPTPTPTK
ncbi:MAG: outer membrane protein transport protein [Minicystis sp.]